MLLSMHMNLATLDRWLADLHQTPHEELGVALLAFAHS